MRCALALILVTALWSADQMPAWVLSSILKVETKSWFKPDGSIHYTDKRRGTHGELGPFQMRRIAFDQIKQRGEQFWMIETNREFAEECAVRYLCWLHDDGEDWLVTVEQYNAGPGRKSPKYLKLIKRTL